MPIGYLCARSFEPRSPDENDTWRSAKHLSTLTFCTLQRAEPGVFSRVSSRA